MDPDPPLEPRYSPGDVGYFLGRSPYVQLMHSATATAFVRRHVEAAEECVLTLRHYPALQIEPLTFSYAVLRSLGVCDARFFAGMMTDLTWRGVVWGSWLALIAPAPFMLRALISPPPASPRNADLVRCARAMVEDGQLGPGHAELAEVITRLRAALRGVRLQPLPIRMTPSEQLLGQLEAEQRRVRSAYRVGGVEAARRAAEGTLIAEYLLDYRAWVRLAPELRRMPYQVAEGSFSTP